MHTCYALPALEKSRVDHYIIRVTLMEGITMYDILYLLFAGLLGASPLAVGVGLLFIAIE